MTYLLVSDQLDASDRGTDVLGSSRDRDEVGWVIRLGDADHSGGLVHDLLDDLALLADEEHVVVLGHGDFEAGLLLELDEA